MRFVKDLISKLKKYREDRDLYLLDLSRAASANRFFDVNIDENHYLGCTRISINDLHAYVYFFCDKSDLLKRFYVVKSSSTHYKNEFECHLWLKQAELWKIGEYDIYQPVITEPSVFLSEYMLEHFQVTWDTDTRWWKNQNAEPKQNDSTNIIKFEPKGQKD